MGCCLGIADDHQTNQEKIDNELQGFIHKDNVYVKVRDSMTAAMNKGLSKKGNSSAIVKMLVTYVTTLPSGNETGDFLALDLGGTNFRVLRLNLKGNKEFTLDNKIFPVSDELMTGKGSDLFDYMAECISKFMKEMNLTSSESHVYPLGFTFSFPCVQSSLPHGTLIKWTKGFTCSGVEGKNVVKLLQKSIDKRGDMKVKCVALINDTVGCLAACCYTEPNTKIGVILGTGTNACYVESIKNVEMWYPTDKPKWVTA